MNKVALQRNKRKLRTRANIFGTKDKPRLSVYRSNVHISAQLIDDASGKTLLTFSDNKLKDTKGKNKVDVAFEVGSELAKAAKSKKINRVIFDKGQYAYHGRVKAVAEGARDGGLTL